MSQEGLSANISIFLINKVIHAMNGLLVAAIFVRKSKLFNEKVKIDYQF